MDEQRLPGEAADAMALRLAREKAAVARGKQPLPVLAADTVVVVDDAVFGKPQGRDDALAMLARLSGRSHKVMTGVAMTWDAGRADSFVRNGGPISRNRS